MFLFGLLRFWRLLFSVESQLAIKAFSFWWVRDRRKLEMLASYEEFMIRLLNRFCRTGRFSIEPETESFAAVKISKTVVALQWLESSSSAIKLCNYFLNIFNLSQRKRDFGGSISLIIRKRFFNSELEWIVHFHPIVLLMTWEWKNRSAAEANELPPRGHNYSFSINLRCGDNVGVI